MRKVIYWVHTSVDGFVEGPDGEFDWAAMGPGLSEYGKDLHARVDTFLYGRRVWELMSSYWPTAEQVSDDPHDRWFAPVWRSTPKVVVSRTLTAADWDATVVGSLERLRALTERPGGDLLLSGGSELAARLAEHGLVHEYHVAVHPVVLGGGRPVLPLATRLDLSLAGSTVCDDRVTVLRFT